MGGSLLGVGIGELLEDGFDLVLSEMNNLVENLGFLLFR